VALTDFFAEVEAAAAGGGALFGIPDYLPQDWQEAHGEDPRIRAALRPAARPTRGARIRAAWRNNRTVRALGSAVFKSPPDPKSDPVAAIARLVEWDHIDLAQVLINQVQDGRQRDVPFLKLARHVATARGAVTLGLELQRKLSALGGDPADIAKREARLRELTGWTPALPGLRERIEPSGEDVVVTLAKMSLPFLANDYTSRSHRNFLAAQDAGITTVVITELGFPRILGVSKFEAVEVIDGIEHRRLDRGPGCDDKTMPVDAWAQAFAEDAYDVVREVRPSLLHVSSGRRGYETMLVGIALKEKTGLPLVYEFRSFHDATWTQRPALHDRGETYLRRRAMESMVMSVADVVLTLNEAMRDELVQMGCAPEKIHLVPNGVDLDHFAPRPRPRKLAKRFGVGDLPTFGYISNMDHPRESQETLVRAAEVLKKRGLKDFRCVIVGRGPRREFIEELASASDVADVVVFTDTADRRDVADYYALIDVFVVPRTVERAASLVTPLQPLEAMALGRPIVISDLPALREIASPEERGLVFPPDDAVALADAVQRLFDDPELAARLGEAGREWVVNERQWSMNGPRYAEAFAAAKASTVEP
jgi:glycosyltransferase involved in cell wall biosynthesis